MGDVRVGELHSDESLEHELIDNDEMYEDDDDDVNDTPNASIEDQSVNHHSTVIPYLVHTKESAKDFIYTKDDGSVRTALWNPSNPKYIQSGMLFMNKKQMKYVARAYNLALKKEFPCDQSKSKSWKSINGFKSCRPVICIDGTHLYGLYDMKLLIAVGIDANGNIFPLAYALVARESFESWS
ncbi:uncharacterized protein LOC125822961 [Solanum verrucosum]|uniref:uncharacterized protein LOC125822961 n=1 Tax=Solanum verrucosum TaxID=315347 RepID=UPI0020D025CB|nr:uncharacterized protein LOC125822961 [Solanum verrucosum]